MRDVPPTPVETLERHCKIASDAGLRYAYIGNVPGHALEHTYCPECGKVAVGRYGFAITSWNISGGRCGSCGHGIPIIGEPSAGYSPDRLQLL